MSESGLAFSTAKCYLSGISFVINLHGWKNPVDSFIIKKLLLVTRDQMCLRILENQLHYICWITMSAFCHICFSDFEATLFQSAFTLAFFALLRVSKVVVLGNKHVTVFNDTIKVLKHPRQTKLVWDHLCMFKNQMLQCLFLIFAEFCRSTNIKRGTFCSHLNSKP